MISTPDCSNSTKFSLSNFIFNLENELKIRDDFIEIYSTIVNSSPNSQKKPYTSQSHFYFYSKIWEYTLFVQNYDPYGDFLKKIKKPIERVEFFFDSFGFIDSLFNIFITFCFIGSIILYSVEILKIVSVVSSVFTIILALINLALIILSLRSKFVKKIMERLLISPENLTELRLNKRKETMIGAYIWDNNICFNPRDSIRGFLILLILKFISKNALNKVKYALIKIVPDYLPEYAKDKNNLKFLLYVWKWWKNYYTYSI